VGYGADAFDAYNNLENFKPRTFTLATDADDPDIDGIFILNWTESQFADSYSIYRNNSLIVSNLLNSQTSYTISELNSGIYEYFVQASNEFGNTTSNTIMVNVKIYSIAFNFEMDNSMTLPDDLASFRIVVENLNESITSGYDVKVNLSLYREGGGVFSVIVPPVYYPLENRSFSYGVYSGINFTLINDILYSGEGLILNGFISCTTSDIIIRFKWTLIVDNEIIHVSEEDFISVT